MEIKLNAIAFLNLPNDDNNFLKNTYPDLYYDIIDNIYNNINEFCKYKTIYIKYKQNRNLSGSKIIDNFKYYKLT